jgi:hypothetical protein
LRARIPAGAEKHEHGSMRLFKPTPRTAIFDATGGQVGCAFDVREYEQAVSRCEHEGVSTRHSGSEHLLTASSRQDVFHKSNSRCGTCGSSNRNPCKFRVEGLQAASRARTFATRRRRKRRTARCAPVSGSRVVGARLARPARFLRCLRRVGMDTDKLLQQVGQMLEQMRSGSLCESERSRIKRHGDSVLRQRLVGSLNYTDDLQAEPGRRFWD